MTVSLDLPDEALARLRAEAKRRDISVDALVAKLAADLPAQQPTDKPLSFIGLGASTSGYGAADTDELLAQGFGRS